MSELTAVNALSLLLGGNNVERSYKGEWEDLTADDPIDVFFTSESFRLKPKTITINGIEVPACGENYKYGDLMYILNSLNPSEYDSIVLDESDLVPAYWWRTEDEIKKVVAALRQILNK